MISMKDYLQVEVTGDADAVTSDLYVENTTENPALYTVENNHVSLVSKNVEKCIELETDMLDDCTWESRIKITKDVANQSNMELPLEYQDVTDNIYLNPGNTSDIIFHCNICGKSFAYNYLLKKHLAKHKKQVNYKTNKCKFCEKSFKLKFGLDRHIQKHHNSMRATIVSTALHTNILNNDIISYPEQTKIISNNNSPDLNIKQEINFGTTLRETNSSDQMNLANSNESNVLTASQNSMTNILNVKKEKDLNENDKERNNSDQIEHQPWNGSEYPTESYTLNEIINLKQEAAYEISVVDHLKKKNDILLQSHLSRRNGISNNNSPALNIKREISVREVLFNDRERNSLDQVDSVNSNESILANEPRDLMVEQFSINTANSNESNVLTTSQNSMANIQNIKQEKDLYTNVRERNSSDQVDSVNSNESILANEPRDLRAEQFPINTANNNIVSIVRDMPYFCIRKLSNIKNEFRNDDNDQTLQNRLIFTCRICKNSPSTDIHSFALHMSDHRECNMHECIVCDKTFKSVVLWTAHMTYHQQQIDLNVSTVQFNNLETESYTFDPINSRNMEPQVFTNLKDRKCKTTSNTDSATMSRNQKKETKSSSTKQTNFCNLCNRQFTKRCYFTNHMMMKHNINTNTAKQLTSIDCNESIILSENIELTNEYENKLSVPVNNKNNNLNNRVKKSNKKKSKCCILCNKHFAYIGALINHMRIHGEQFPCDVCEKKFSTPFQLNVHRKSHSENVPYVCTICNKSFKLKTRWNFHLKSHYIKDDSNLKTKQHTYNLKPNISKLKIESISHKDKIKCRYCKKECNSISQWKNHMSMNKECHRHGKSYLPEFTTNSTYERTSGQSILVNKKNIMKYICEICKIKFADNITLQKHTKIHTLNMYKCNDCGQQYETNHALGIHIWENHSDI